MAVSGSFRVIGVTELLRDIEAAPAVWTAAQAEAMKEAVQIVAREARAIAPRRTGRLVENIQPVVSGRLRRGRVRVSLAKSKVPYAKRLERGMHPANPAQYTKGRRVTMVFGRPITPVQSKPYVAHVKQAPRPFLKPALRASQERIQRLFIDAAKHILETR